MHGGYRGLDARAMAAWAVALWRSPVHERRAAAVEVLALAAPRLSAADLVVIERATHDETVAAVRASKG